LAVIIHAAKGTFVAFHEFLMLMAPIISTVLLILLTLLSEPWILCAQSSWLPCLNFGNTIYIYFMVCFLSAPCFAAHPHLYGAHVFYFHVLLFDFFRLLFVAFGIYFVNDFYSVLFWVMLFVVWSCIVWFQHINPNCLFFLTAISIENHLVVIQVF